jgi:hypothetical protein
MFVHLRPKVKGRTRKTGRPFAAWDTWAVIRLGLISLAALALTLAVAASGCGGGDGEGGGDGGGGDQGAPEAGGDTDPEAVEVIDAWSDALREGDLVGAARRFRVPSVAQNGTPPLALDSKRDVLLFNASLPCGAELTETEQRGELVIATFELTERPGPGECGPGVGIEARTAFRIEDGLIVEWLRVADEPGSAPPIEGPIV